MSENSDHQADTAGEVLVFNPTLRELEDFPELIKNIELKGAHKTGIAKIIPPDDWTPCKDGYSISKINRVIPSPICQFVLGKSGLYKVFDIKKKNMTVEEFYKLANSSQYQVPENRRSLDFERIFWKNILYGSPIYGADVPGTLMDEDLQICNINNLGTILDLVANEYGKKIAGVNTSYLYFGMWKSMFPWHTEDMDLYSINYLHFGATKTWYVIPPEHGQRFERTAKFFFPHDAKDCDAFLRHKSFMISPLVLHNYNIPFNVVRQKEREIIITFPYAYHAGFNNGFNIAEATNFASPRWIEYGKKASKCFCRKDTVKIDMGMFVKRFQPDKYKDWLNDVKKNSYKRSYLNCARNCSKKNIGDNNKKMHKYFDPISKVTVPDKIDGAIEIASPQLQPFVLLEKSCNLVTGYFKRNN